MNALIPGRSRTQIALPNGRGLGINERSISVFDQALKSCILALFRRISWSKCHKGCPYNRFTGAYFHSNYPCRLPPTPPIMKMAVVAIRESPLREIGRGLFSEPIDMAVGRSRS